MANFTVVGRADSVAFAKAERIVDILSLYLLDIRVQKKAVCPDEWHEFRSRFCRSKGIAVETCLDADVVCLDSHRLCDDLGKLALQRYGQSNDLSDEVLEAIAADNLFVARAQRDELVGRAKALGKTIGMRNR